MIITKETKTNGLMEDLELVIQLIIDQSTLKLKAISKSGMNLSQSLINLVDFNKPEDNNSLFVNIFLSLSGFLATQRSQGPLALMSSPFYSLRDKFLDDFLYPTFDLINLNIDNLSISEHVT